MEIDKNALKEMFAKETARAMPKEQIANKKNFLMEMKSSLESGQINETIRDYANNKFQVLKNLGETPQPIANDSFMPQRQNNRPQASEDDEERDNSDVIFESRAKMISDKFNKAAQQNQQVYQPPVQQQYPPQQMYQHPYQSQPVYQQPLNEVHYAPQSNNNELIKKLVADEIKKVLTSELYDLIREAAKDVIVDLYTEEKTKKIVKDYLISLKKK